MSRCFALYPYETDAWRRDLFERRGGAFWSTFAIALGLRLALSSQRHSDARKDEP